MRQVSARPHSAWIAGSSPAMTQEGSFTRRTCARALATTMHQNRLALLQQRGRRSAERRMPTIAAQHQQTSPSADASVAAARHADECTPSAHSSACGARPPSGASTAALARDFDIAGSASGHASWDADKCVIRKSGSRTAKSRRALPALSCPSPVTAPHASAVVPKGLMPEAAPARIASPRGSTALAPHYGSHPECVPR
jgi:hypothetical protein